MKRSLSLLPAIALTLCAQAQTRLDFLRGDESSARFAQALEPHAFEFPRDHGPHPDFRHEWWYVTGHLRAADGERFGFELTFFRYALVPAQKSRVSGESAWRSNQIYMAHFAVTDVTQRRFNFEARQSRAALGLAGAEAAPFRVWLEDWALESSDAGWSLHAALADRALDLEMQPLAPVVLNGDQGLSRKSALPGAASYYYSIPEIQVRGSLKRDGAELAVTGTAWLDREWGSGALAPDQVGWDWFALQLDDGSSLMFYALRRRDGTRDPYSAGTWVDPSGKVRSLSDSEVRIDVLDHWTSARGDRYPSHWRLSCAALGLEVTIRPPVADQELKVRPRYWEGAVDVKGHRAGNAIAGRGYVELVGYAAAH
jgi:predicted secreted hydrolase